MGYPSQMPPRAILFDLDDTILRAYAGADVAWLDAANEFAADLAPLSPGEVADAVVAFARKFWADAERHRLWRVRLLAARRAIVAGSLAELARAGRPVPQRRVGERLADRFSAYRDEQMCLFPDAHTVIDTLKARGTLLGLVTNGAAEAQRAKIARFDLAHRFDHIQIEGEHDFGKPDARAYLHALRTLGVDARETWMVGDNLEWEVVAPQRIGIHAIWFDGEGKGLPQGTHIVPDQIIRTLSELLSLHTKDPPQAQRLARPTVSVRECRRE
jgi:putative hydrolase of the HAD superfamily